MFPVAPGVSGLPPSSPKADSNESTPCSSAASTLASPCPRVLWKWAVSSTPSSRSTADGEELADLARVRHPGRVAERDLLAAGLRKLLGDLEHARRRDLALVGTAEGDRDHALAAKPLGARRRDGPLEARRATRRSTD